MSNTELKTEPGIYPGVTLQQYLAWPYVNNTLLQHGRKSMAHLKLAMAKTADTETDAMRLGSLVHAGCLDLSALAEQFSVMPAFERLVRRPGGGAYSNPRATNQYRELVAKFETQNGNKTIVTQDQYDSMESMLSAMAENDRATSYLAGCDMELAIVWDDAETGVRCKSRIDALSRTEHRVVDLKSTRDVTSFGKAIANYGYHRQAAMYCDGIESLLLGAEYAPHIIAVESSEPYAVLAAPLSAEAIETGRRQYRAVLREYAAAMQSGHWPGPANPDEWALPSWATAPAEPLKLLVNGHVATL